MRVPVAILRKLNKAFISGFEWIFVSTSYLCFSFLCYYCLFVIGSYYHQLHQNILIDCLICLSFSWFLFNIVFNYVMTLITSPGIAKEK